MRTTESVSRIIIPALRKIISKIKRVVRTRGYFLRARRARGYFLNAVLSRRAHGPRPSWFQLASSFVPWWLSFDAGEELTKRARPWITYPAVRFLERKLQSDWQVFEFGSGASTLFFALRCREICAVEHDTAWVEKVQRSLDGFGISNCRLRLIPAELKQISGEGTNSFRYGSKHDGWEEYVFEKYARSIDDLADRSVGLVLVDGRAREACLRHAIPKVSPGGVLVLDNSERPGYQAAINEVPNSWLRFEFPGPSAQAEFFSNTTIWVVPQDPPEPS